MVVANIDPGKLDKIFHLSIKLTEESVLEFISCLCELSKEELDNPQNPRIFCMHKISEVTDFNMNRVRYIW